MEKPDRLALVTYLSLFYELFQDSQPFMQRVDTGNELEVSTKPVTSNAADKTRPSSSKISECSAEGPSAENPVDTVEMLGASQKPVNSKFDVQTTSRKVEVTAATAKSGKASKYPEKPDKKIDKSQKKKDTSDMKVGTSDKKTDKPSKQSDKKADKLDKCSDKSGKEASTAGKQLDRPGKMSGKSQKLATSAVKEATPADKQLTSANKCAKKLETSPPNNVASTEVQIMSPVEILDKKKKRKFHLFPWNKKKSLATATPSIER